MDLHAAPAAARPMALLCAASCQFPTGALPHAHPGLSTRSDMRARDSWARAWDGASPSCCPPSPSLQGPGRREVGATGQVWRLRGRRGPLDEVAEGRPQMSRSTAVPHLAMATSCSRSSLSFFDVGLLHRGCCSSSSGHLHSSSHLGAHAEVRPPQRPSLPPPQLACRPYLPGPLPLPLPPPRTRAQKRPPALPAPRTGRPQGCRTRPGCTPLRPPPAATAARCWCPCHLPAHAFRD